MIGLTPRQRDALRFIAGFQKLFGFSPSFEEIRVGLGLASKNSAALLVSQLEERGIIRKLKNRARAIEVLAPVAVPRAPDGEPLFFVPIGEAS
ncbi:MAG: hypothetical protein AAFZ11_00815 [Pseudomonadota bacterium]